jgi:hypothetical protein
LVRKKRRSRTTSTSASIFCNRRPLRMVYPISSRRSSPAIRKIPAKSRNVTKHNSFWHWEKNIRTTRVWLFESWMDVNISKSWFASSREWTSLRWSRHFKRFADRGSFQGRRWRNKWRRAICMWSFAVTSTESVQNEVHRKWGVRAGQARRDGSYSSRTLREPRSVQPSHLVIEILLKSRYIWFCRYRDTRGLSWRFGKSLLSEHWISPCKPNRVTARADRSAKGATRQTTATLDLHKLNSGQVPAPYRPISKFGVRLNDSLSA